jgi:uncharacterized protein YqhQ
MFGLCESELKKVLDKNLGIVNTGIHSYRIFNIAYMDVIMTIVGSLLLAWLNNWSYIKTIIGMFILGIIVHRIFCVRTTVDKLLFPNA